MKVVLINGSPKIRRSTSGMLLSDLKSCLLEKAEVLEAELHKCAVFEDVLEQLKSADALVFVCPLYVDGIPGHLLSCLVQLEKIAWRNHGIHVYGIVNGGFHEGIQAEYALQILQNWCGRAGLVWGGGIGVGGGGGLGQMPTLKNGRGPKAPVEGALRMLANRILQQEVQENDYVSVAFPRFLYKMAAQMGWRQMIKANGGKAKDLGKQL